MIVRNSLRLLLMLLPFSLLGQQSDQNVGLKDKPQQGQLRVFYPMQIGGDFNGDEVEEPLETQMFSALDNKPIDTLYYDGTAADLNRQLCDLSAQLRLVSDSIFEPLTITDDCNNPGLWELMNLGNINDLPGDEIAFVTGNLELNTRDHCYIFTYCKNSWKNIGSFKIHEFSDYQWLKFNREENYFYWFTGQEEIKIDCVWSLTCHTDSEAK